MADGTNKLLTLGVAARLIAKSVAASADPDNVVPRFDTTTGRYDPASLAGWHRYRRDGRIFTVKVPKYAATNGTECLKADDAAGLVCEPSTNAKAGRDDFASFHAFEAVDVNGGADDDGSPYVTAISGDGRYKSDGTNGDAFVMAPVLFYRETEEDGYFVRSISDVQHDGFSPQPGAKLPDGTLRPYILYTKYVASRGSDGKMASASGKEPWCLYSDSATNPKSAGNMSLNEQNRMAKQVGAGYGGHSFAQHWYLQIMTWLKHGAKSSQTAMKGCTEFSNQYTVSRAESGKSRVLLGEAQAKFFPTGSFVSVGEPYDNAGTQTIDRFYASLHSIARSVRVTGAERVDETTWALNLDCPAIETTATSVVSAMPWHTGATDSVMGLDGSPTNPVSGKEPYRIQGIETFIGVYEVFCDVMVMASKDESGAGHLGLYLGYDNAGDTGLQGTVSDAWSKASRELPFAAESNEQWAYVTDVAEDPDAPGFYMPTGTGATSTTGTGDAIYANPLSSQGTREWLSLGVLWLGSLAGLSCGVLSNWCGYGRWNFGGRLSALARSTK